MDPNQFLGLIRYATDRDEDLVRLGTVGVVASPATKATVVFDGEDQATAKEYFFATGDTVSNGDRIVLIRAGHSWLILGKVPSTAGSIQAAAENAAATYAESLLTLYDWFPPNRNGATNGEAFQDHGSHFSTPDPGYAVRVTAFMLMGGAKGPAVGDVHIQARLEISFDNGATWHEGPTASILGTPPFGTFNESMLMYSKQATPSSNIKVRLLSRRWEGDDGTVNIHTKDGRVDIQRL